MHMRALPDVVQEAAPGVSTQRSICVSLTGDVLCIFIGAQCSVIFVKQVELVQCA